MSATLLITRAWFVAFLRRRSTWLFTALWWMPPLAIFFCGRYGLDCGDVHAAQIYLSAAIPLAAVLGASTLLRNEFTDQTLTYLWVRPVPRPAIFAGKWLALWLVQGMGLLPAWLVSQGLEHVTPWPEWLSDGFALWMSLGIFDAGAAAMGLIWNRPMLPATLWIWGWELQIVQLTQSIRNWTTIRPAWDQLLNGAPMGQGLIQQCIMLALFVAGGGWLLQRKSLHLRQWD